MAGDGRPAALVLADEPCRSSVCSIVFTDYLLIATNRQP
jgi:hypothetical protein